MSGKQKKRRMILAGCIVLVCALLAALILLRHRGDVPDETTLFLELTADRIRSVRYTTEDGEEVSFTRTDGVWETDTGRPEHVDQLKAGALASSVTGVKLVETIEDPGPAADYGLDKPSHTLTVEDTDGNTWNIQTGSVNDTAGVVYCTRNMDGIIYCASNVLLLRLDDPAESYGEEDTESGAESGLLTAEEPEV